jgi:CRP-like cAMP-binding protein
MVQGVKKAAGITGADALRRFHSGEYVFREGDLGTEMYVVHEGRVEILKTVADEKHQIAVLEKGDFFGEMSLLEELPRNATARALVDTTLIEINGAMFDRMLRRNPEIAVRIMRKLSRRVRQADEALQQALGRGEPVDAIPTEPVPASFQCRLRHAESGVEHAIDLAASVTVGRVDPVTGIAPHVDLSSLDLERSSSRRHAKLILDEGEIYLVEEIGTLNGTFINGRRLQTAVPEEIHDGDRLRFGLVEFVFETKPSRS